MAMPHAVAQSPELDPSDLVGVSRERSPSDQLHLEVVKRLIDRKQLSLTGLAVALRQKGEWGSTLAQTVISAGLVRPIDYYQAVAEVLNLPFVDLQRDPIDPELPRIEDRADYADRNIVPWRRIDGRIKIAVTEVNEEHFHWAALRYGQDGFDFVITSPFDILWQTQQLFRE